MGELARRRLSITALVLLGLLTVGTLGYMLIEGWPPLESLYMTVTTITTVGFGEVRPLSAAGRAFTMLLILSGVGTVAYVLGSVVEYVVASELANGFADRRRRRMLATLTDHFIVCGFGRVGQQIAQEFDGLSLPFVVIDNDEAALAASHGAGYHTVRGDATSDDTLVAAGIERARGLLTALGSDVSNLYVVLSARSLRPDILIVARADQDESERKMLRAGANRVLSLYPLGGRRMAELALRPNIVQFLDMVMHVQDRELWLEEVEVPADSPLVGVPFGEARIRDRSGALILAVIAPDGSLDTNPAPTFAMQSGSRAIALGSRAQLRAFCDLVSTGRCTLL